MAFPVSTQGHWGIDYGTDFTGEKYKQGISGRQGADGCVH